MSYDFNNDTPIYLQIIDAIKREIISKKYKAGEKLPSVRELSLIFSVNPNTIQKALGELEEIGLIFTERTNGKFVTNDEKIIEKVKMNSLKEMLNEFFNSMAEMGFDKNEVIDMLNKGDL